MKIFQIVNGFCHWKTPYQSVAEVVGKYPPDCLFVETPDYVFEGWGYDNGQFIQPMPPEGWVYSPELGQIVPIKDAPETEAIGE